MKKLPRHAQQGFALPTVLGLGFISMMLTATLLERARSEQIGAGIQARSDLALGATEAGLARFRSFLDQNRQLSIRNAGQWQPDLNQLLGAIGNCENIYSPANLAELERYATGEWQDLPNGHYRLLSYQYQSSPKDRRIGIGRIAIEGRTGQPGQEAHYVLEAELPIALNEVPIPALWTQRVKVGKFQKIAGEVRNRSCPITTDPDGVIGVDKENLATENPLGSIKAAPNPWLTPRSAPASAKDLNRITRSITLPRKNDEPDERGNFNYRVASDLQNNSIHLTAGSTLKIQVKENQRVNIYTDGDLLIAGTIAAEPNQLRIYGSTKTNKVSIEDSAIIKGIIHAPLAVGSGIGSTKVGSRKGYIEGALWLAEWNGDLQNSQISIQSIGNWANLDMPMEERIGLRLDPLSGWRRRENQASSSP
jgi:hypothetical protein